MNQKVSSIGAAMFGLLTVFGTASFALTPATLRTETKVNPLGIGESKPLLSWIDVGDAGARGELQTAYRIVVADTPGHLTLGPTLWDSGKVMSDNSVGVEFGGTPLASRQSAAWAVQVWDEHGKASALSAAATFEVGLLHPHDWQGTWIESASPAATAMLATSTLATTTPSTTPTTPPTSSRATAPAPATKSAKATSGNAPSLFRKTFTIDKPVKRARLYSTAMGLYDARLDGTSIGDAVLKPDWTDYHKRIRYQTYDLTSQLTPGPHVLAATLADGWYSGHLIVVGFKHYGDKPALRAQLVIDFDDDSSRTISTDGSWKTGTAPMSRADLYDGEDYDARKEQPGWDRPQFDDESWVNAIERQDTPQLDAQVGPAVRQLMELPARSITEPAPGHYTFDMGQNMVGYVRLTAEAQAGTKVTLRFAEMLKPDGTVYTDNLRQARATDTYIFKGNGQETFTPQFTFHGFRYVEITGLPAKPDQSAVRGVVIGSDTPSSGHWNSSSEMLNKVQSNIVWGQRGNYVSVPTDCPQRDERLGWMGDAQVFVRTATFNSDVQSFFDNWIVDVADAQTADGAYTDVSPNILKSHGTAAWADAGVICPWTIYQVYGDRRMLQRQYPSMVRYINYLKSHSKDFIRPNSGYGDWLSIKADTRKDLLATAYFAYSAKLMAKIADALDKPDDARAYTKLFDDIRSAFDRKWVKPDGRLRAETQTSYLLALKVGLLGDSEKSVAVTRLVDDIHSKDNHLSTGFVGVSYLLPTLTQNGHTPLAYTLLNQDTFPSWLFSVKHGATTIWERWDGWTPEKGFQTPEMNSFNHYSLGSCGEWMYDTVAGLGIDPSAVAFKKIIFRPTPGGGLTSASAHYDSVRGPVACQWATDALGVAVNVTVPPNTTATLHLPATASSSVTESGLPALQEPGVSALTGTETERVYSLGSGVYHFYVQEAARN